MAYRPRTSPTRNNAAPVDASDFRAPTSRPPGDVTVAGAGLIALARLLARHVASEWPTSDSTDRAGATANASARPEVSNDE